MREINCQPLFGKVTVQMEWPPGNFFSFVMGGMCSVSFVSPLRPHKNTAVCKHSGTHTVLCTAYWQTEEYESWQLHTNTHKHKHYRACTHTNKSPPHTYTHIHMHACIHKVISHWITSYTYLLTHTHALTQTDKHTHKATVNTCLPRFLDRWSRPALW